MRVWRSGLGIDRHGNLIYAVANYQTVGSLAEILRRAGAVRAMELDINEDWVSFNTYRRPGALDPSKLLPEIYRPAESLPDPRRTRLLRGLLARRSKGPMIAARRISPAARARRALLADLIAAIALAAVVLHLASGLGVVGFFGLPLLLAGLLWIGFERLLSRLRPTRRQAG